MESTELDRAPKRPRVRRRHENSVPKEGENGLFSQSWFPICLSTDVEKGSVIGRDFLDGRVVVFRTEAGEARVMSAYCPHLGADLSVGTVVGDGLKCAFHQWEFDDDGWCVKTGAGDPPPKNACLFIFPVRERFGIIWAFNGEEPLWEFFDFEFPDDELEFLAFNTDSYTCDPWIFASNTPDIQHIKTVHGIRFRAEDPHDLVEWDQYGFRMRIDGFHQDDEKLNWNVGIRGTSTFIQEGTIDDWWMGVMAGFSMPRPGSHQVFLAIVVKKGDGSEENSQLIQERLNFGRDLLARTAAEDKPILDSIHHRAGILTETDRTLARYFKLLRNFPRAHPSADFIV